MYLQQNNIIRFSYKAYDLLSQGFLAPFSVPGKCSVWVENFKFNNNVTGYPHYILTTIVPMGIAFQVVIIVAHIFHS